MVELPKYYPPPPKGFVPATGATWAEVSPEPPLFARPQAKPKGVRADGLRYERKVHKYLRERFGDRYVESPWVRFLLGGKEKYCQPDGFIAHPSGQITIIEAKLSHTSNAYWQLKHLYLPVLQCVLGQGLQFKLLEICKFFDAHTKYPEYFEITNDLECPHSNQLQVHVWKGR